MYFRDGKFVEYPVWLKWILGFFRALSVSILSFLLLSPLIKSVIENQKNPIVMILEDASQSIEQALGNELKPFVEEINELEAGLADKYEIKRFHFGDQIDLGAVDSFDYKVTNLSKTIKYISDNYGDQNVGAIILSSDGIYNEGSNPIYQNTEITAPIFSVAIGDTTRRRDLILKDVFHNKIVYLGDKFNIQVDIQADNCSNQRTRLTVFEESQNGSKKLLEKNVQIDRVNFFTTEEIGLSANRSGVIKYRVELSQLNGEILSSNNSKDIYVEVLDARQKVLIYADAPHPDLAAIKSAISSNKNYSIDLKFVGRDQLNASDYNMVIFHNLPSQKSNILGLLKEFDKIRTPRMFIVGKQTNLKTFNEIQNVLNIGGSNNQSDEVQAIFKPSFSSFTFDEDYKRIIRSLPPLNAPFGKYKPGPKTNTLLYQRIGRVDTDYPLLAFSDINNIKTAILSAEGIWKWKLANFMEQNNHDAFNELLNKAIQFTTVKNDKRKFRADVSKNVFKENEQIRLEAQLFNDTYEAVNEPDVFAVITDQNKKEFNYTFSKKDNYYTLNPGYFKAGKYNFEAKVNYNGKELKDKGSFTVKSIQLEKYDLQARHNVMYDLSKRSGGKVFSRSNLNQLQEEILTSDKIKPILYSSNKTQSILSIRWILGLLILLLILEWFLRRYFGTY